MAVSREIVIKQLINIEKIIYTLMSYRSVTKLLSDNLCENETIMDMTRACSLNRKYLLVATQMRLMTIFKPVVGRLVFNEYSYDSIKSFGLKTGFMGNKFLIVFKDDSIIKIEFTNKKEIRRFEEILNAILENQKSG